MNTNGLVRFIAVGIVLLLVIVSVQKEDDTSYTVNGKIIGMTSVEMTQGGNAGETSITFTLKKVKGTWLIDEVK
ncbi:hypothetical protein [Candidatus Cryosericum terrychapinii]|uniref:DUF4878 domain-containing protein n=1 Tax=Candidatus Cryosericum terrychapinii TaxID=2290919 RepID=A0A398CQX9_9BACT|nr:hypothetical protein [Candidatus Cryosericum terrychapinii]RIE05806.1 hypothetical protein SMC7_05245 [Candidatus Cryosericum terrychapinii]